MDDSFNTPDKPDPEERNEIKKEDSVDYYDEADNAEDET